MATKGSSIPAPLILTFVLLPATSGRRHCRRHCRHRRRLSFLVTLNKNKKSNKIYPRLYRTRNIRPLFLPRNNPLYNHYILIVVIVFIIIYYYYCS